MKKEDVLRDELLALLRGGNAHLTFEEVVEDFPPARINDKVPHMPRSAWHLLEHMRKVQWDIVSFIHDPDHISPQWPHGYFPGSDETADETVWSNTIKAFLFDRAVLESLVSDRSTNLFLSIAHAPEYTLYREILLAADHNAYHTGELAFMRQVMQAWPGGRGLYG